MLLTLPGDKFFFYKMKKLDLNGVFKLFFEELLWRGRGGGDRERERSKLRPLSSDFVRSTGGYKTNLGVLPEMYSIPEEIRHIQTVIF